MNCSQNEPPPEAINILKGVKNYCRESGREKRRRGVIRTSDKKLLGNGNTYGGSQAMKLQKEAIEGSNIIKKSRYWMNERESPFSSTICSFIRLFGPQAQERA